MKTASPNARSLHAANDNAANDNSPTAEKPAHIIIGGALFREAANRVCNWKYEETLPADAPLEELHESAARVSGQLSEAFIHFFPNTPAQRVNISVEWVCGTTAFKRSRDLTAPTAFDETAIATMSIEVYRAFRKELLAVGSDWRTFLSPSGVA